MSAAVFVSLRLAVKATLQRGALMSPGPDGEGNFPRSVYSILSVCHFYMMSHPNSNLVSRTPPIQIHD